MGYKALLFIILASMTVLMIKTILSARKIPPRGSNSELRSQAIKKHSIYGYTLLGVTFTFLLLIELKKPFFNGVLKDGLFYTHLPIAILFFLSLLAIVVWFNGNRFAYHPWLGYLCVILFLPTVATGIPMIWRMTI